MDIYFLGLFLFFALYCIKVSGDNNQRLLYIAGGMIFLLLGLFIFNSSITQIGCVTLESQTPTHTQVDKTNCVEYPISDINKNKLLHNGLGFLLILSGLGIFAGGVVKNE